MLNKSIFQKIVLFSFPLGILGIYLGVVSMYFWLLFGAFFLSFCKRMEVGLFFIFLGTSLFGRVFGEEFMVLFSTVFLSLAGMLLLRKEIGEALSENHRSHIGYGLFILFFVLMYLLGYHNNYTQLKILKLVVRGIIWYIAFIVFVRSSVISYSRISVLFLFLALFYLSQSYQLYNVRPSYMFDFYFFRDIGASLRTYWEASVVNPHTLGYIGIASLLFRLMDDNYIRKGALVYTIGICLLSFLIVIMSGARQTLICYIIVFSIGIVRKMKITGMGKLLFSILMLFFVLVVAAKMGSEHMNRFLLSKNEGIAYKLHRDIDTPLKVIKVSGVFGLGFGGYGEYTGKAYPHNLFIEILTEYGMLGAVVLIAFSFILIMNNGASVVSYKTARGSPMILLFITFFMASMISGDIASNISVFALLFCCVRAKRISTIGYLARRYDRKRTNI